MNLRIKERTFTTVMVILATIVVLVLAALQYRWSNQISEATSIRLADSLQMSMINWHLDFFRDFSEVCVGMNADSDVTKPDDFNEYAHRFAVWRRSTAHPTLVSSVYVMEFEEGHNPEVHRLDPETLHFDPAKVGLDIAPLRQELKQADTFAASRNPPGQSSEPASPLSQAMDREFAERFYPGGPLADWQFEPSIPALVRPLSNFLSDAGNAGHSGAPWIILVLNEKAVEEQLLPDLAERYFRGTEGLDYQVAVVARNKPEHLLYTSDAGFGEQEVTDADGTMDIFGRLQNGGTASPIRIFHTPSENKGPAASVGITWFPLLRLNGDEQDWRLVVRHRRGGALGAFVADSRRRDLSLGFGVLFLLVISIAILIITSMRAQRLARLQMDFVTAVSHELRTPLTVISSAAENIAHGVVEGKSQLEQYGTVIGVQARKLFEMVEQILLFAAIREGHQRYILRPLAVTEILDAALSGTAGLVCTANFQVQQEIEPNLPAILGDLTALSQCLQNLITNALKYGSDQRWIGIRAALSEHGMHGREIQISVTDRGIGIDSGELQHIFEPFYRSPSVMAAQIHGTGLGLPLAKSIVEAMKGHLSVRSKPGNGSTFTLHLPCVDPPAKQAEAKPGQAVASRSAPSSL
jgi:signal transduction histidine kinase